MDPETAQAARDALRGPALGLLVSGILGVLAALTDIAFNTYALATDSFLPVWAHGGFLLFDALLGAAFTWTAVIALRLKDLRCSKNAAYVAAVIAVLPVQGCCCITIGFGVWAMVVLARPEVGEALEA